MLGKVKRKVPALLLVIMLVSSIISVCAVTLNPFDNRRTIVVPDDFSTIQDAVKNASAGDTVFVKSGTYFVDGLEIRKPLKLIGENTNETIIDAKVTINQVQQTIIIASSNVSISGFTILNSYEAILIDGSDQISDITIASNFLVNNSFGIVSVPNSAVNIIGNKISNNVEGVYIKSANSLISANSISMNYWGIAAFEAENLTIVGNNIVDNSYGVYLGPVSTVNICQNNITGSTGYDKIENRYKFGLGFRENCNNTLIHDNNIEENSIGISLQNNLLVGTIPSIRNPKGQVMWSTTIISSITL